MTTDKARHRSPIEYPHDLPRQDGQRFIRIRMGQRSCPWQRFELPAGFIGRGGRR